MKNHNEKIEQYLKGVIPPEHASYKHQEQLRQEVLGRIERKQTMSVRVSSWKYAAVIALISTGVVTATVVGVKIYKYHYLGTDEEGHHRVLRDDGRKSWVFSKKTAGSPEQAVQTAEEMDLLIQQGTKELVSIREIEVNGQLDSRLLGYDYTLSDGRKVHQFEDDPDTGSGTLTNEQQDEARHRFDEVLAGSMLVFEDGHRFFTTTGGEVIPIIEQVAHGRVFSFTRVPLELSDGTQISWSIGTLSESNRSALTTGDSDPENAEQTRNDLREIAALRQQDNRKLIAVDELTADGELDRRVFVYQYKLSDGRTKDLREGDELNFTINSKQRKEWVQLKDAGSGEDVGTYEQKVEDQLFVFKRQKFTLSDGTELIWSYGTLKNDQ